MNSEFLKSGEVAEKYKVTKACVTLWVKKGLKFYIKKEAGRKPFRLFKEKEINEFLNIGIRR